MREAANQHNIFIRKRILACACARALSGVQGQFKRDEGIAFARARQTPTRCIEKRAMRRTDERIAQSV